MKSDVDKEWYRLRHRLIEAGDRECFSVGFEAGAQWAMRTSSALSPHIAQFLEMITLLGFPTNGETETPY